MKTYLTRAGDSFDLIAYQQLGSCNYVEQLINANRNHIETFIFKAGVELQLPNVQEVSVVKLPPWRRE